MRMPGRQVHAGDVLGAGLLADQQDRLVGMASAWATAASAERTTLPDAAPGLAAMPCATGLSLALGSSCGRSRWFRLVRVHPLDGRRSGRSAFP